MTSFEVQGHKCVCVSTIVLVNVAHSHILCNLVKSSRTYIGKWYNLTSHIFNAIQIKKIRGCYILVETREPNHSDDSCHLLFKIIGCVYVIFWFKQGNPMI